MNWVPTCSCWTQKNVLKYRNIPVLRIQRIEMFDCSHHSIVRDGPSDVVSCPRCLGQERVRVITSAGSSMIWRLFTVEFIYIKSVRIPGCRMILNDKKTRPSPVSGKTLVAPCRTCRRYAASLRLRDQFHYRVSRENNNINVLCLQALPLSTSVPSSPPGF